MASTYLGFDEKDWYNQETASDALRKQKYE